MRTRSSSNVIIESFMILKRRNRRRSKQIVEPELLIIIETPVATMADTRTMSELLQAPTEGYGDVIVIPPILAENFELKVGLLQLVTLSQFHGFERDDPHAHIFAGGNLLNRTPRYALTIIENKSKIVKELVLMNKATQQATVKAIEETCVTCDGPHPYYECLAIDGNTFDACAAVGTYKQGGNGYRPQGDPNYHTSNQMGQSAFPPLNVQNNQNYNQNCNTNANPRGDVKAISTQIGVSYEGPSIPPTSSSLSKEVEREPKKLSILDLTPTHMTIELATRSIAYPAGIAEDVFVQVVNMINFNDITCEDRFPKVLEFKKSNHPSSGCITLLSDSFPTRAYFETSNSLLEEFVNELALLDPFPLGNEDFDIEADL
nr:reverse transcriptase domain-containing protein [Tanacetum cinerariifolium]